MYYDHLLFQLEEWLYKKSVVCWHHQQSEYSGRKQILPRILNHLFNFDGKLRCVIANHSTVHLFCDVFQMIFWTQTMVSRVVARRCQNSSAPSICRTTHYGNESSSFWCVYCERAWRCDARWKGRVFARDTAVGYVVGGRERRNGGRRCDVNTTVGCVYARGSGKRGV